MCNLPSLQGGTQAIIDTIQNNPELVSRLLSNPDLVNQAANNPELIAALTRDPIQSKIYFGLILGFKIAILSQSKRPIWA